MRISIIGCGSVAEVHATRLRSAGFRIASVFDSLEEKAQAFGAAHEAERVAEDLDSALEDMEATIISSPSNLHFEHALSALEHGVHVLVELPPCDSADQVNQLTMTAERFGLVLQCAHTSRYLEPYRRISQWIGAKHLGEILQLNYFRCVLPKKRAWTDDALLHHAAHPLDLLLHWFGSVEPVACVAAPCSGPHRDVSLLARLPNGAPVSVAISYSAKHAYAQLSVVGDERTIFTDGFSFIDSADSTVGWYGDAATIYENAIGDQDEAFLRCCESGTGGVLWRETARMMEKIGNFQSLQRGGVLSD